MRSIVERINELQEVCVAIPNAINLPQIVVIGGQSTGKSSVLENILGDSIIPQGTGMVTRRPLMIQMIPIKKHTHSPESIIATETYNTETKDNKRERNKYTENNTILEEEQERSKEGEDEYQEREEEYIDPNRYYCFSHLPGKRLNKDQVKREIIKETERTVSNKYDVSAIPILLKVFSTEVLPITLIDLPGIIKVPTNDQSPELVTRIEDITREYIKGSNTIILAITPANTDIAGSDALMMARMVDPDLKRTLCVLTKVDLMDPGTDILDILQGRTIKVNLGYIPVVCRGEEAIKSNQTIEESLRKEKIFFSTHKKYSDNQEYCGVPYLKRRLYEILELAIEKTRPALEQRINTLLDTTTAQLDSLGETFTDPNLMIMQSILLFKQRIDNRILGNINDKMKRVSSNELLDGGRIARILDSTFPKEILQLELDRENIEKIEILMMNMAGLFREKSITTCLAEYTKEAMIKISTKCNDLNNAIEHALQEMINSVLNTEEINRYFNLKRAIKNSVHRLLRDQSNISWKQIQSFLEYNTIYIREPKEIRDNTILSTLSFTEYPSSSSKDSYYSEEDTQEKHSSKPEEKKEKEEKKFQQYLSIHMRRVKLTVIEQVPKIIVTEMIYKTLSQMQKHLLNDLCLENKSWLMEEEESTKARRESLQKIILSLRRAKKVLSSSDK
ncbi:vacuolar protein sorting-associated protein 1 [Nematocida sp. AWRm80]|nr:vacuolar protein sorting-associated protein 1 [Nematocida sp. AWRm80]